MKTVIQLVIPGLAAALLLSGCELSSKDTVQRGFRGTGMELVINENELNEKLLANQPPEPSPAMPAVGPKAGDIYQNVEVLGHLSIGEFTRLMAAITEWVAPEEGCNYCHYPENLADDRKYTKKVSRAMIVMTQRINEGWQNHVGDVGVTCYTCHRGNNIPMNVWATDPGPPRATGAVGQTPQNYASPSVGFSSLPYDPFTPMLQGERDIGGVQADTALPQGHPTDLRDAEWTYALMMHFSNSLGVNCTYCHNTRAFNQWDQASPAKVTAWHGIRMVRELNNDWIEPVVPWLPEHRKGPRGDALKANCLTCHQGAYKPLFGAEMLKHYPNLAELGEGAEDVELFEQ